MIPDVMEDTIDTGKLYLYGYEPNYISRGPGKYNSVPLLSCGLVHEDVLSQKDWLCFRTKTKQFVWKRLHESWVSWIDWQRDLVLSCPPPPASRHFRPCNHGDRVSVGRPPDLRVLGVVRVDHTIPIFRWLSSAEGFGGSRVYRGPWVWTTACPAA